MAPDLGLGDPTAATPNEIPLEKKAGVLILPVMVNDGLPVDFVLDSGASDISMPAEMVEELVRSQGLTAADLHRPAGLSACRWDKGPISDLPHSQPQTQWWRSQ